DDRHRRTRPVARHGREPWRKRPAEATRDLRRQRAQPQRPTGLLRAPMARLAVLATLAALVLLAPAARADGPYGDAGGFYSVLGVGQGQTTTAADLAQNELPGAPPPSFVNQLDLYSGVSRGADTLTTDTLTRYWKPSSFRAPDTDNGGGTESPRAGVTIVRDA